MLMQVHVLHQRALHQKAVMDRGAALHLPMQLRSQQPKRTHRTGPRLRLSQQVRRHCSP